MPISTHRLNAFHKQSGLCYYCNCPMWLNDAKQFAKANVITVKSAARFQCTAEHLIARSDGGKNSKGNIVAACKFCNQARHKRKKPPTPPEHRSRIMRRLERGKWHPICQDKFTHKSSKPCLSSRH